MTDPDRDSVEETVRRLIGHWDDGSLKSPAQSNQLVTDVRKLNSADFITKLGIEAALNWTENHTKSINYCFMFCSSDWFCPVINHCKENPKFKRLVLWICEQVSHCGEIPELPDDQEKYGYDKADFVLCAEKVLYFMQFCTNFIKLLIDLKEMLLLQEVVKTMVKFAVVSVCCNSEQLPWTNSKSIQAANDLKQILFGIFKCSILTEFLILGPGDVSSLVQLNSILKTDSILLEVLSYLRPKLSKGKWKQNPSYLKSFVMCLFATKSPHLGEYLDNVLPVVLMLVDDFRTDNKRLGLQCLSHIIENTSRTELIWQGRAEVIFEAVKLQLYSKEVVLLEEAIPCMLAILTVIEPLRIDHGKIDSVIFQDSSKFDDIFNMILFNAEMESLLVLRRVYTKNLDEFIKCMGISVVKHSKRLLNLVSSYLETSDGPSETARLNTLLILNAFICRSWPRISRHVALILKSLLRLVYDISVDSSLTPESVKAELMDKAKETLLLLKSVCSEDVNKCLRLMLVIETTPQCKQILHEVLET